MNWEAEGLMYVLMLMRLRGVKPTFKANSKPYGPRAERRRARLRLLQGL